MHETTSVQSTFTSHLLKFDLIRSRFYINLTTCRRNQLQAKVQTWNITCTVGDEKVVVWAYNMKQYKHINLSLGWPVGTTLTR